MPHKGQDETARWKTYYQHHKARPASPLLLTALGLASAEASPGTAVNLGGGAGIETRTMLEAGWDVLTLDREPAAIESVRAMCQVHSSDTAARLGIAAC